MIDPVALKMFAQLDDTAPGLRVNALEMLRDHFAKQNPPVKFAHLAADLADAVPKQKYLDLEHEHAATKAQLQVFVHENNNLAAQLATAQQQLRRQSNRQQLRQRVPAMIRLYRRRAFVCLALPVIAFAAYQYATAEPAGVRAAADAGFQQIAKATAWAASSPDSGPAIQRVSDAPYWVIIRRDEKAGHVSATGSPVTVQCVHLFAEKAEVDAGAYLKPRPYTFGGLGWLTWSERASDCRTEGARRFNFNIP